MDFPNESFLDKWQLEEIETFLVGFWDLAQKDVQSFNRQNHGEFKKDWKTWSDSFRFTLSISAG